MEMIVLINLNDYIGGGETLFVRFVEFLINRNINICTICKKGSYIEKKILEHKDSIQNISLSGNIDYYYLNKVQRKEIITALHKKIGIQYDIKFVTFCLRDLYIIIDLAKKYPQCSITHLILHILDYLYVCQSLFDKFLCFFFHKRIFSRHNMIEYNVKLLKKVNENKGLISMSQIINEKWKKELNIAIPFEKIIPLPACKIHALEYINKIENKSILWIGRLVDFKLPSLLAMIDFIASNEAYSLTIVGDGEMQRIKSYVQEKKIDESRITFLGEVHPSELKNIIKEHAIGYAMGTSIIEIAQYGKPVIVALSAPKFHSFKRMICGGLFCNMGYGNIGSDLNIKKESDIETTIPMAIKEIEDNYDLAANKCYNKSMKEYDMNTNFNAYHEIISNTLSNKTELDVPHANWLRRLIYRWFS